MGWENMFMLIAYIVTLVVRVNRDERELIEEGAKLHQVHYNSSKIKIISRIK